MTQVNHTSPFLLAIRRDRPWLIANALGLCAFVYFCSRVWAPASEAGLLGGPGDPFIWTLTAFPVLAVFAVLNLIWIATVATRVAGWRHAMLWLIVVASWASAMDYNRYRAYTGAQLVQNPAIESCCYASRAKLSVGADSRARTR